MWRGLPKACSSKSWLSSNRSIHQVTGNRSFNGLCLERRGEGLEKHNSFTNIFFRCYATQLELESKQSCSEYGNSFQQNDEGSLLTEDFGSLSLKNSDVFIRSFSNRHLVTESRGRMAFPIPTTFARKKDSLPVSIQDYFESLGGEYDVSGMLFDFAEAAADRPYLCSSNWLSAVEKSETLNNAKAVGLRLQEKRPSVKPGGLRQKHLLARWRAMNRKSSQTIIAATKTKPVVPALPEPVEVDVQEGFLLCGEGSIGGSNLSLRTASVFEEEATTSESFGYETSSRQLENVDGKANFVSESVKIRKIDSPITPRRDRFDPLDVRAKVAPVDILLRRANEEDIEGLREVLNEYRWPSIQTVRPFINEIFSVFIKFASDVDEVKFLMWDFAATDNRAFVADSLTLRLLERIIREEGLHSASAYAKQHRDLFLVRPPIERDRYSLANVYEELFVTAIGSAGPESARSFVDLLIELGYLEDNNDFFVFSVQEKLKSLGFGAAYDFWCLNTKNYRTLAGVHLLIRTVLKEMNLEEQEKHLRRLLEYSLQYKHPYATLGELIIEFIIANRLPEAEILMKKLTISGRHLRLPLQRLKGNGENLVIIERVSEIIGNCLFAEQKLAFRKTSKQTLFDSNAKFIDSISQFLATKWSAKKKLKYVPPGQKVKKFIPDPVQIDVLSSCIQDVWTDVAQVSNDIQALGRLHVWCSKYNITLDEQIVRRHRRIYEASGQVFPLKASKSK